MNELSLVTGGAGFIGSHLVEGLVADGWPVRVLDDLSTGLASNLAHLSPAPEVIAGDVGDPGAVARAMQGVGLVFHLAALASVQRSVEAPADSHRVCATGTLHVLDAARRAGVRRVVYAASASAYGIPDGETQSEATPLRPLSPYAAAKLAGEVYCEAFTATYGLETVRLRFFNIFGPRQRADSPYSGVIAIFRRGADRRPDADDLRRRPADARFHLRHRRGAGAAAGGGEARRFRAGVQRRHGSRHELAGTGRGAEPATGDFNLAAASGGPRRRYPPFASGHQQGQAVARLRAEGLVR